MEIFKQTNFDFLGKKWPFIWPVSGADAGWIDQPGGKGGPKYGIDFTGGALMDVEFVKRPRRRTIRSAMRKKIPGEIEVQEVSGTQEVLISDGLAGREGAERASVLTWCRR